MSPQHAQAVCKLQLRAFVNELWQMTFCWLACLRNVVWIEFVHDFLQGVGRRL
jgi:hypothetical protein